MSAPTDLQVDKRLDCKGLSCPLPIVRTKKAMDEMNPGQVIEVQATDRGSLADIQGWAKNTGHQYLGTIEEKQVLKHYLRKSRPEEVKNEQKYSYIASNEELQTRIADQDAITILDVREPAEYAFGRIPGAQSIPLGELEQRMGELNPDKEIYVVCRTGSRSDLACQLLADKGFKQVKNVTPGMAAWNGPVEPALEK
ncbi:sulfurtransferase TusA family protein [Paenibacillus bouchesdurhonensis]|uniref:sulfurtransferase TusA family protein n=1 Tax=Paenibacillus bouchesdurhonensis TaxID=1870990 RepID=UPI000DA60ABB|nr:sulfurtransferase TusA family protein [Paenibacillus bouchesdurhonensis]